MDAIKKCLDITEQLVVLAKSIDHQDRDETIKRIEQLLNEREQSLPLIKGPLSIEEKNLERS
ncbi:hypothetical protein ACI2OX_05280 [Bacillus sp. N9]